MNPPEHTKPKRSLKRSWFVHLNSNEKKKLWPGYIQSKSNIFILLHTSQDTENKYWRRCIHRPHLNNYKTSNHVACIPSKKVLDLRTRYTRYIKKWQKTNILLIFMISMITSLIIASQGRVIALLTLIFVTEMERDPSHPAKNFLTALRYIKATTNTLAFSPAFTVLSSGSECSSWFRFSSHSMCHPYSAWKTYFSITQGMFTSWLLHLKSRHLIYSVTNMREIKTAARKA